MQLFQGISASPGMASGKAILARITPNLETMPQHTRDPENEINLLRNAQASLVGQLEALVLKLNKNGQSEEAEIFSTHILLASDPEIEERTIALIRGESLTAPHAFSKVTDEIAQMMDAIEDEYLRSRATDIRDVQKQILGLLLGDSENTLASDSGIFFTDELTPSQILKMNKEKIKGIATQKGSRTSHSAILARSFEIPAVFGLGQIMDRLDSSTEIILDADLGTVTISPNQDRKAQFEAAKNKMELEKFELEKLKFKRAETLDGHLVQVAANIAIAADLSAAEKFNCEGVGLYRTEFVFMGREELPTEDDQVQIYRKIFSGLNGKHCTIRTLDIGGDKDLKYLKQKKEENPFLGLRGVRLCLENLPVFRTQIKAILRAAHGYSVGLMVPMISNIDEIKACRKIFLDCQTELAEEGKIFSSAVKFGIMIEVPAIALSLDLAAKYVDFVSVGSNDLTQYTNAVDRLNESVEKLYDPFNPGFLRILKIIFEHAENSKLDISICGSIARDQLMLPFLIGIGVRKLSMTPQHVPKSKRLIRSLHHTACQQLVTRLLALETSEEIQSAIQNFLVENP